MSQHGPEPVTTVSPLVAQIAACYAQKKYQETAVMIAAVDDVDIAEAIYKCVFRNVQPACWIAFFKNTYLNQFLCYPHLVNIVKRIEAALKNAKEPLVLQSANKMLLTIVHNEEWCRTLSYRFFIDLVALSKPLATYVVSQPAFLMHLHYPHLSWLIAVLPDLAEHLIETLDSVILADEQHTDRAIAMLKWLLIQDEKAKIIILSNERFNDLLEQLFIEFEEDRLFAMDVLKNPRLCQQWLETVDAYQHPLLNRDDYRELALHYLLNNEKLSMQYVRLAGELLEKELLNNLEALTSEMAAMQIDEITKTSATYTPAREILMDVESEQQLNSKSIEPNSKIKY